MNGKSMGGILTVAMMMGGALFGAEGTPPRVWVMPPDLRVPWKLSWESGEKSVIEPDANGCFDLRSRIPKDKKYESAVCRIEFEMEHAGLALLGLGADWYLDVRLNGAVIFDSMKSGNGDYPPDATNHIFPVWLRAGCNELSIRSKTGDATWIVCAKFFEPTPENLRMCSRRALLNLLIPEANRLDYAPWAMPLEKNGMMISFITAGPVGGGVEYRVAGTEKWSRAYDLQSGRIRTDRRIHRVPLTELIPGKTYEYRVLTVDPQSGAETAVQEVRRLAIPEKSRETVRFFAFSDLHRTIPTRVDLLRKYWSNCNLSQCDMLISLGDFANKFDLFEYGYFAGGLDFLQTCDEWSRPLVAVRGNHEFRGREADDFFSYFASPAGVAYYGFRYGPVCFLILDAGECDPYNARPGAHTVLNRDGDFWSQQRRWLADYVKTPDFQEARYRIVLAHGAPIATGPNHYMADHLLNLTDGILTGDAPAYTIDLWLAGHIHQYRRDDAGTISGIPFPVLFADGPDYGGRPESAFLVTADSRQLRVEAVDQNGQCFDRWSIQPPKTR